METSRRMVSRAKVRYTSYIAGNHKKMVNPFGIKTIILQLVAANLNNLRHHAVE